MQGIDKTEKYDIIIVIKTYVLEYAYFSGGVHMPPKPKFTKQQITDVALELVAQNGVEALSARELGKALGSSSRPIFTVFDGMEQLQSEVTAAAMRLFESYADKTPDEMPAFKRAGMQMLMFANEQPKLFRLLFMRENKGATTFEDIFGELGGIAGQCVRDLRDTHGLCDEDARTLFENVWIYTFGVGVLCATGACRFSYAELGEMLTMQFNAVMMSIKSNKNQARY